MLNYAWLKKKNQIQPRFESITSAKGHWKEPNELINRNIKDLQIKCIKCDYRNLTSSQDIADVFNDYFVDIGPCLSAKVTPTLTGHQQQSVICSEPNIPIYFRNTTEKEVIDIIENLISSEDGFNSFKMEVLKYIAEIIAPLLGKLINKSFRVGQFPQSLKSSGSKYYHPVDSVETSLNSINNNLGKLAGWYQQNKLSLVLSKTKALIFTRKCNWLWGGISPIMINNYQIERVDQFEALGVFFIQN